MSWRPTPVPLTDTESAVITHLSTILPEAVVRPDMVGWSGSLLWVMVVRTGGVVRSGGRAEDVFIDVQAIAPGKPAAWDLASAVTMAMLSMPDVVSGVRGVTQSAGWAHIPMPDTIDGPSRYAAGFTVLVAGDLSAT